MAHTRTTRTIVSLGIVVAASVAPTAAAPAASLRSAAPKPTPVVEEVVTVEPVIFAFDEDEVVYNKTMAAFEKAGFPAPKFLARFHTTAEPCKGYYGLHVKTSDGVSTVNVCATHDNPLLVEMVRERTLMHEVAHVWISQNVDEQQMAAFMELRGLTVWDGAGAEWGNLGAEHAAEILLWGMTGETRNINFQIDDSDLANLRTAYALLAHG